MNKIDLAKKRLNDIDLENFAKEVEASNQTTHTNAQTSVPVRYEQPVVSGWDAKASGNLLTAVAFMVGVVVLWKRYRLETKRLDATSRIEDRLEQVLRCLANEQLHVMKELNESLKNAQR